LDLVAIKLALGLAVLVAGAAGVLLPLRRSAAEAGRFLSFGNALAAGVFLGAGLIHMLSDANRAWTSLGWDYPMAFLVASLAFVLLLLFEHVLLPEHAHEAVHAPASESFAHLGHGGASGVAAYAVLTSLSVHSFVAGIALGAAPELAGALVIAMAILAHKMTAGFALGVSLVREHLPRRRALGLAGLFATATPLGIMVGMVLGDVLDGRAQHTFEAVFLALAGGTFVYVATLDILRDELHGPGSPLAKWLLVSSGLLLMALLALWV
jgi:zinc transporter 1/2/3